MTAYTYNYPRPMVTVDAVVFSKSPTLQVLLIERKHDPFAGCWALPGGFVDMEEPLEAAVIRELEEETGLTGIAFEQLRTFGEPNRDPRGRTISVAYMGFVNGPPPAVVGADDAARAAWFPIDHLPRLAFDHSAILEYAISRLK